MEEKPATDPTSDSLPVQTSIEQPPEVIAENIPDTQDETAALPPIEVILSFTAIIQAANAV